MAYQQVSTPRFFCDIFLLLKTLGIGNPRANEDVFTLNPANIIALGDEGSAIANYHLDYENLPTTGVSFGKIGYMAYLGHNVNDAGDEGHKLTCRIKRATDNSAFDFHDHVDAEDEIAYVNYESDFKAGSYNGFSLAVFDIDASVFDNVTHFNFHIKYTNRFKIGCASIGSVYTMTNAPNLSLTMSRDYGTIKEFTTYNGSSMSNQMNAGNPKWGSLGAWELGNGAINQNLARSGRRSWNLKFSFMGSSDLWGSNQMLSTYLQTDTGDYDTGDISDDGSAFNYNLLTDDNFFAQVWQKTLGGSLSMIMQMDKDNNNPDGFAIVRFKKNSLKATQTAPNVYDISLDIEEVW